MISIYLWSASLVAYYTVYFHIRYLPGDLFINTLVFAGCEVTAYMIGSMITKKIGMKPSFVCSFMLAVFSTIVYLFIRDNEGL
jgi:Na+/melibiose symporter-like transporter